MADSSDDGKGEVDDAAVIKEHFRLEKNLFDLENKHLGTLVNHAYF